MPDPRKVHISNVDNKDMSFFIFILLFFAVAGSLFLSWNDVTAGRIYTSMFTVSTAFIFLLFFFIKDNKGLGNITKYIKIPISTSNALTVRMYILGFAAPFVINFIVRLFTSFSITSFSIPLFGASITQQQSFAAASIENSTAWKLFNIVFVAGTMETWVFNFALMLVGVGFGIFIMKMLNKDKVVKGSFIPILSGLALSMVFFVLSHLMNKSYTFGMFLIAGLFLVGTNLLIYFKGFFLSFIIAYHQANNLIYLIQTLGIETVLNGFLSWFGILFVAFWALIIFFLLNSGNKKKSLSRWWSRS